MMTSDHITISPQTGSERWERTVRMTADEVITLINCCNVWPGITTISWCQCETKTSERQEIFLKSLMCWR